VVAEQPNPAVQDEITAFWSSISRDYDSRQGNGIASEAARAALRDLLAPLLPTEPSDILDLATGTGALALIAAALCHRVTGIDLAEGMLAVAREKASALTNSPAFLPGDAIDPPVEPDSFDVVMSRFLVWTLREPRRAFAAWLRALRPGGRLVVIDGFWFAATDGGDGGRSPYSADTTNALPYLAVVGLDALTADLHAAGFTAIETHVLPYPAADDGEGSVYTLVAQRPRA
jgi:SAM-dependent methyltransferase